MKIEENIKLSRFTTFGIGGPARYFCRVADQFDALEAFEFAQKNNLPTFVLGGGSNLLVSDSGYGGLVMKVENKGIEIISDDKNQIQLKVASGEVWDEVVNFATQNNWWGIENLSHIPGSAGAIAVQNVGAYGQEAKNVIESVTVFDRQNGQIIKLSKDDCGFAYRSSIFNTASKGRYIIFYVDFLLQKNGRPNLSYRDLRAKFSGQDPSLNQIRETITEIRDKKFPFPAGSGNGNAGSFFKNPILDNKGYGILKNLIAQNFGREFSVLLEERAFADGDKIKIPAAFLLDICGLKDEQYGGAKINCNQPLVIVNYTGEASSGDILMLAVKVLKAVKDKTGIALKAEPELLGFTENELKTLEV